MESLEPDTAAVSIDVAIEVRKGYNMSIGRRKLVSDDRAESNGSQAKEKAVGNNKETRGRWQRDSCGGAKLASHGNGLFGQLENTENKKQGSKWRRLEDNNTVEEPVTYYLACMFNWMG